MENASKALLIAGSVLIVILLIAVGVRIFNSTQGTTDQVEGTMKSTEVAMFNNKFLPYIGKPKTKNDAIALVNLAISSNATSSKQIDIKLNFQRTDGLRGVLNCASSLDSSQKLYIYIYEYDADGYIKTIYISKTS